MWYLKHRGWADGGRGRSKKARGGGLPLTALISESQKCLDFRILIPEMSGVAGKHGLHYYAQHRTLLALPADLYGERGRICN